MSAQTTTDDSTASQAPEPTVYEYTKYDMLNHQDETRYIIVHDDRAEYVLVADGEVTERNTHDFDDLDGKYLHGHNWTIQTRDDVIEFFDEHHNYTQTDGGDAPDAL